MEPKIYSYEDLETSIGGKFRTMDNYDLEDAHFFPVSFLDSLFEFSQKLSIVENRRNPKAAVDYCHDDFNVWVDNMVANAKVRIEVDGKYVDSRLIDIEEMQFADGRVKAVMAETSASHIVCDRNNNPVKADDPEDLKPEVTTAYHRQKSPLENIEYLASLFYRAGKAMKVDINNANVEKFREPFFKFFKFDMIPMIPALLEDLEQIADEELLEIRIN